MPYEHTHYSNERGFLLNEVKLKFNNKCQAYKETVDITYFLNYPFTSNLTKLKDCSTTKESRYVSYKIMPSDYNLSDIWC